MTYAMLLYFYLLIGKLSSKIGLRKVAYNIARRLVVIQDKFESSEYIEFLNNISLDPENSSIHENRLTNEYDLQVIIPVYNSEHYLEKCIDSVVSQNGKYKILITIINDGSTDRSREILKRYESFEDVEIIDQPNKGFSGARNTGLSNIKAEYIAFVDSDDILPKNSLELLMDCAKANNADIAQGAYDSISENDEFISHFSIPEKKRDGTALGFPWGKVYRSDLWRNVTFPEKYWFEDTVIYMILFAKTDKISSISETVYNYRINTKGISCTFQKRPKVLDSFYVTKQLLEDRLKLDKELTQQDYERFLRQLKMNHCRILTMRNYKVSRAVFSLSIELYDKYFSNFNTNEKDIYMVEDALKRKSHMLYLLSVV